MRVHVSLVHEPGQAKVSNHDMLPIVGDKNVLRLQVAVNNGRRLRVQMREDLSNLPGEGHDKHFR